MSLGVMFAGEYAIRLRALPGRPHSAWRRPSSRSQLYPAPGLHRIAAAHLARRPAVRPAAMNPIPPLLTTTPIQRLPGAPAGDQSRAVPDAGAGVTAALPPQGKLLNLCGDRYAFAVALFAAISKGLVTVLLNSSAPEHLAAVAGEHPDLLLLGDQASLRRWPACRTGASMPFDSSEPSAVACAADRFRTAGRLCSHLWLYRSAGAAHQDLRPHVAEHPVRRRAYLAGGRRCSARWSAPRRSAICTGWNRAFPADSRWWQPVAGGAVFPADVARCLAAMPAPRLLVITPFHLRKLIEADIERRRWPRCCRRPPLAPALAQQAKRTAGCPLLKSTVRPKPVNWRRACRVSMSPGKRSPASSCAPMATMSGAHGAVYRTPQLINDMVELDTPTRFRLIDRKAGMINVAGKRSSLSFLNAIITSLPGVGDAVFCVPEHVAGSDAGAAGGFVVAPGLSRAEGAGRFARTCRSGVSATASGVRSSICHDGNGKIQAAAQQLIATHISNRV